MLDEHKMFEKFGGGETSKKGQAVEISCETNNVSQFRQALRAGRGLVVMTLKCAVQNMEGSRVPLDLSDVEGICPPYGGTKC